MQDSQSQRPAAAHYFEEHTAEVRVRIEADTLERLFEQAGLALAELMLEPESPPIGPEPVQSVQVQASDREALLVEWLNELIYQSETHGCVYNELSIEALSDNELRARIGGLRVEQLRTAVKAATWHALSITQDEAGFHASVVLDV